MKTMDEVEAETERRWKEMHRWLPWYRKFLLWLLGQW
jgi:hypothetical protein